jgi:hypothetical protein
MELAGHATDDALTPAEVRVAADFAEGSANKGCRAALGQRRNRQGPSPNTFQTGPTTEPTPR